MLLGGEQQHHTGHIHAYHTGHTPIAILHHAPTHRHPGLGLRGMMSSARTCHAEPKTSDFIISSYMNSIAGAPPSLSETPGMDHDANYL